MDFEIALAALDQRGVEGFLVEAERLLGSLLLGPCASRLAGEPLGLADMEDGADRPRLLEARIDRDHRDAGGGRLADRVAECCRVGQRDDEAFGVGGVGRLDQLRHVGPVARGSEIVLELDPECLGRVACTLLDHLPERVPAPSVGDHDDALGVGGRADQHRGGRERQNLFHREAPP